MKGKVIRKFKIILVVLVLLFGSLAIQPKKAQAIAFLPFLLSPPVISGVGGFVGKALVTGGVAYVGGSMIYDNTKELIDGFNSWWNGSSVESKAQFENDLSVAMQGQLSGNPDRMFDVDASNLARAITDASVTSGNNYLRTIASSMVLGAGASELAEEEKTAYRKATASTYGGFEMRLTYKNNKTELVAIEYALNLHGQATSNAPFRVGSAVINPSTNTINHPKLLIHYDVEAGLVHPSLSNAPMPGVSSRSANVGQALDTSIFESSRSDAVQDVYSIKSGDKAVMAFNAVLSAYGFPTRLGVELPAYADALGAINDKYIELENWLSQRKTGVYSLGVPLGAATLVYNGVQYKWNDEAGTFTDANGNPIPAEVTNLDSFVMPDIHVVDISGVPTAVYERDGSLYDALTGAKVKEKVGEGDIPKDKDDTKEGEGNPPNTKESQDKINKKSRDWGKLVTTKFPFSLPWDFYFVLSFLASDPKTPKFEMKQDFMGMPFEFTINLNFLDPYIKWFRGFIILGFAFSLILLTRKLLGGAQ